MTKTAFLFAGQGAQVQGMGRDLYDVYPLVRQTYDEASEILGYDLRRLIDEDAEKLNLTRYTQPAILTTSIAIYRLLEKAGLTASIVAGLSLGEYSALVASGALDFKTAVALVQKRGKFMEEAVPAGQGKMVAVMNAEASLIEAACQKASSKGIVAPANYNTPAQIVIGGEVAAVDAACEELKAQGVKRLIPLKVSGPFHTELLVPASEKLAKLLSEISFSDFDVPLVGNTEAKIMAKSDIAHLLARQVMSPVRFYDSIATIKDYGATRFIEIGPGKVLSGFMKKIDKTAHVEQVDSLESFKALVGESHAD